MRHVVKASCFDRKGTLISAAYNNYEKTHPIQAHFANLVGKPDSIYLHAEVAALLKCGLKRPYRIHIERYKRDGTPGLAKPCPICQRAILAWGIKETSYTCG
jgi:deoxycytidylate deaminase